MPITQIAESVGTPFYCYSAATLTRHFHLFQEALSGLDHLICFAMKSNGNLAVLKLMSDLGAGIDVVSGGEYRKARAAGVPGDRIVFSGVGKTAEEMRAALEFMARKNRNFADPVRKIIGLMDEKTLFNREEDSDA